MSGAFGAWGRAVHRRPHQEARPAERGRRAGREERRSVLVGAAVELWRRTAGGRTDRLPDPARHPECWFKLV